MCTYACARIHINVGSMLARSKLGGHARASDCGTGKSNSSHIFFYAAMRTQTLTTTLMPNPGTIGN